MALLTLVLTVMIAGAPSAVAEPRTRIVPAQKADETPPAKKPAAAGNQRKVEIVPNQSYWNTVGQVRYNHYYDGGAHWYGFHHGHDFYWTRFHHGYWWGYDPYHTRWTYWSNGNWWWAGPGGVTYVYVDNSYRPAEPPPLRPTVPPPGEKPPEAPKELATGAWKSPDGSRLVQINGADHEAFLYDATAASPTYLKYLGRDAERARFSGGQGKAPLRLVVEYKDGTVELFDRNGEKVEKKP